MHKSNFPVNLNTFFISGMVKFQILVQATVYE